MREVESIGPSSVQPRGAEPADHGGRLLVRGGVIAGFGYVLRILARLAAFLFAAYLFGAALFGAFVIAIAIIDAAVVASGLSTKWILFKWLDANRLEGERRPGHVVLDAALLVLATSGLIASAILLAAVAAPSIAPNTRLALLSLLATLPLQALTDLSLTATRWTETMRYELIAKSVIQPFVSIALAIAFYFAGWRTLGLPLAFVIGTAAGLVYALVGLERRFGGLGLRSYRPSGADLAAKARAVLPTTAADLTDALYTRIDIYVVGFLLGETMAGVYGLARQASLPVRQAKQSFDAILIPLVSRTVAQVGPEGSGECIASASRFVLLVQLAALILLAAVALPLMELAGPEFNAGLGALLLLGLAETVQGAFALGELLLVFAHPRTAAALTLASLAAGGIGAVLLAPMFGLTGIAAAVVASYAVRALLRRLALGRKYSVRVPFRLWAPPLAAALVGLLAVLAAYCWTGLPAGAATAAIAVVAGLAGYSLVLAVWLRRSRARLLPEGFAAAA